MSTPITNESARLATSDYETWRSNQAANERKRWAQLVAALRALPTGCLDCEIEALVAAHMVASFPDIGPDPLKVSQPGDLIEQASKRMMQASSVQQRGVPDQTGLVWRIDIMRVCGQLVWKTAQVRSLNEQKDALLRECNTIAREVTNLKAANNCSTPRPFDTAPKDGSEILVWEETTGWLLARWIATGDFLTERELERMGLDNTDTPDWFVADFVTGSRLEIQPTHWLPLPERPKAMPACKGTNCGCTDGFSHSPECRAKHEAACSGTIGNALYQIAISECLPEHRELQVKVWSPTPWMVDLFVGNDDLRRRRIRNWCNHTIGRESLPLQDISGNWHEGGVTIQGKTWFGFKTQEMMNAVAEQFPAPVITE